MPAALRRGDDEQQRFTLKSSQEPLSAERQALGAAIETVGRLERELEALRDAQARAQDQWHAQIQDLHRKETALDELTTREASREVSAFIAGMTDLSPVPAAEARVSEARDLLNKTRALQESLDREHERTEQRLRIQRGLVDQVIGRLLVASPELEGLHVQLKACWCLLRTYRATFRAINKGTPGAAPNALLDGDFVETLEPDPRFPIGSDFIDRWAQAIEALHHDASALLPGEEA